MYVMMLGTLRSLDEPRTAYDERYRFADIFATVDRAPERLVKELAAITGVASVETRIVAGVTLDIEGLVEPACGSYPGPTRTKMFGLIYRPWHAH